VDSIFNLVQFMGGFCGIIAFVWILGINKRLIKVEEDLKKPKP